MSTIVAFDSFSEYNTSFHVNRQKIYVYKSSVLSVRENKQNNRGWLSTIRLSNLFGTFSITSITLLLVLF